MATECPVVTTQCPIIPTQCVLEPVAVAQCAEFTYEGCTAVLDGTGSCGAVSYLWSQLSGTPVALNNAAMAQADFVAPSWDGVTELTTAEATLLFELSINGGVSADTCTIYIRIPGDGNGDNAVNAFDVAIVRQVRPEADFNCDGRVNAFDVAILRHNGGRRRTE